MIVKHSSQWQCAATYCELCSKWVSEEHNRSDDHTIKIREIAACSEMVGFAHSKRRFEPILGLQSPLTKSRFRAFWGADIDTKIGDVLRDRLSKGR